jgi:predicted ATP-grasp superfamily ATP-dependent carboligase
LDHSADTLLILGASVRAAAFSALRAGFTVTGGDRFADADLTAVCPVERARSYPADLERIATAAPPGPWLFTGALENHPGLVDRILRRRPLYGNHGDVLRAIRDPAKVADAVRGVGLAMPDYAIDAAGLPRDGSWLRKPRRSAGGTRIEPWLDETTSYDVQGGWYFQRRIAGVPCAAVYVTDGERARLVGISEQLIGTPWTRARAFQYAGSVGPLELSSRVVAQFERLGDALAGSFGLVGLFGVDAVISDETIWPIEVNPRYTASIEVLERVLGAGAMALHVEGCRDGRIDRPLATQKRGVAGKAILYARQNIDVTEEWSQSLLEQNQGLTWPDAADVPSPGTSISAGAPVVTLFAVGPDYGAVLEALKRRVSECEQSLHG